MNAFRGRGTYDGTRRLALLDLAGDECGLSLVTDDGTSLNDLMSSAESSINITPQGHSSTLQVRFRLSGIPLVDVSTNV